MSWNFEPGRPIYQQLAEVVRQRIMTGEYPQGGRLPTVRDLAVEAGVNPNTMQKAFAALEDSGLVYSAGTAGRFVTEDKKLIGQLKYRAVEKIVESFVTQMAGMGYSREEVAELILAKGRKI